MSAADFNILDTRIGDRVLNAAAVNAILAANPGSLTAAALAAALAVGGVPASFAGITNTGDTYTTPAPIAAVGATQGNATLLPVGATDILVSATAATEGIRLRTGVTGRLRRVWAPTTTGVKVYPATGGIIGAAATNAAKALTKNTMVQFYAVDATHWRVSA